MHPCVPASILIALVAVPAAIVARAAPLPPPAAAKGRLSKEIQKDVKVALDEIEKAARKLIRQKGIDWKAVKRDFGRRAKSAESLEDEFALLVRIVARRSSRPCTGASRAPRGS